MKTIIKKVFSLCDDFGDDEELYEKLSEHVSCDTYKAMTKESLEKKGYSNDPIANRLVELGAEDGEDVLIHIDY